MSGIIKFYDKFMEAKSDPRVADWWLMSGPTPTLLIIAVYLISVYFLLPAYMKKRKPYELKTFIQSYNIFQVVCCAGLIYWVATSGFIQGVYGLGCAPVDYSDNKFAMDLLQGFYYTYLLKMMELVETVIFVMRKKSNQVSYLHVYHHSSTFLLSWIGCKFIGGGMAGLPIIINSFIHILMYSYYYMASLGPAWQKKLSPWKPKLTILQMIQFCLLIGHALTSLQPSCHVPKTFLLLWLPNIGLNFKMFYDFYQKNYNAKSRQKSKKKST